MPPFKPAALEDDPIKRTKLKVYGDIAHYARGEIAHGLKKKLGQPAQVTDGREEDKHINAKQGDDIQNQLDEAMGGRHGMVPLEQEQDGLATHVGLGQKQEPLNVSHLKNAQHAGHLGAGHPMEEHKGLLADLTDDEVKKLLGGK